MEKYIGIIIEESLIDNRILNLFSILSVKITDDEHPSDRWHIYTVEAERASIQKLTSCITDRSKWYIHFWNNTDVIIVFKDQVFEFNKNEFEKKKKEIVEYGVKLGIPVEQLDFPIDGVS